MTDPVLDDANRHNRDGRQVLPHILDKRPTMRANVTMVSDPNRRRREVNDLSATVPIIWKDEWEDHQFQAIAHDLADETS